MKNYISIVAVLFWGLSCLPFAKAEESGLISQYVITPTATDIVLSSDIQVSYFTGQANITIPLYETSQLGIPFHVSLNYDGSGYLVNKLPGWTGHGWSLSAGGAITRVQQGQIDEWKRPACLSASETEYSEGYLYHPGLAVSYLDTICGHLYNGSMLSEEHWWFWVKDLQPDIFYFNACGLSGRFFLGNDGEWKVLSDQNVRVEFDIHDESNFISPFIAKYPDLTDCYQPKTIKGFTLIDDKGIRYTFGGSSDAIDYSIPISGIGYECNKTGYSWCANAWYLTRIEDRLGNLLYSLEYERGFFVTHASYRRQESFAIGEASYINNYTTYGIQTRTSAMSFSNSPFKYYSFSISAPTYLSAVHLMDGTTLSFHSGKAFSTDSIAYPSLYNRFYKYSGGFFKEHYDKIMGRNDALYRYYYLGENHEAFMQYKYDQNEQRCKEDPFRATGLKCLDSITVSCNNSIIRKISIRYNEKAPKMHITQVSMTNAEGGDVQQYDLSYNNFEALPSDYLASDFDDWGYYCCEDSVMTKDYEMEEHIVYTGPNTYYVFYTPKEGSVREYAYYRNPEKSKYGNLASIVYPTGGKATFQYEINNYSRYLERNRQSIAEADSVTWCGGLRIRSISLYDKADSDTCSSKREFFYELEDGLSSGELSALPEHVFEWNPSGWMSNSLWVLTVSESSVIPLQTSFGPHVGYSRVVEKNAGEQTIYTYSNFSDSKKDEPYFVYFQPSVTPFDSYGEVGYRRGRLLSIQKMDKNGQKRYESNNIYRTDSIENSFVLSCDRSRGVAGNTTNQLDPLLFGYPTGGFYKMFYPKYDVIRTEEMFYDDVQNAAGCTTDYHKTDYEGDRFDRSVVRTWNGTAHSQDQASSDSIVYRYSFDCRNGLPENDLLANQCEYWNDFSSQHFYPVLEEKTFWDGHRIKTSVVKYGKYNSNQLLLQSSSEIGREEKKRTDYLGYSVLGLPTHIREKGKPVYQLFWDNEKILAIAVNGDSLPITMDTGNGLLVNGQSPYGTSNTLAKIVQYNGLNQISGITDEFGLTHYYRYDGMGRLDSILDHHNRLTESYTYHYQQNGENRVEVLTVLNGDNTDNMLSVNYYNGLGRLTQVTAQGISPLGLVSSYTEYDQKGRKSIIWSPVPMGNEVAMQTVQDYVSLSEATYGEGFGYEKTEYDVMDRVVKTIRPGELWHNQDKGIITQYGFCPSGTVKKYLYQNGVLQEDGYYEQGDLKMISTIDEDGYRKTIYMDYRDRIILERKHQILSDTYYIYNQRGLLALVLQPSYQENPDLNLYGFKYVYDSKDRISTKTIPGCDPVTYEYDSADRVIRIQDGLLRSASRSRGYEYDGLGRLKKQKIYLGNTENYDEVRNYYDNYDIPELDECPYRNFLLSASSGSNAHGRLTATVQRASSGELLVTVMGYDEYGRVCTVNDHGLDSYASYKTISYSFTGDVTEEKTTELTETGGTLWPKSETTVKNYYYPGTKLPSYSVITVKDPITQRIMADHDTIQHLTYDDLGRVVANNRNGTKSDMTYGYDRLHGWITDIRSGGGFEQHLFREAGSFEPKWNGSITAMMWKTPDSDVTRRYDYCYDGLNRLTDAMYCEVTGQSGSSGSGDPNNPQNIIPETLQTEAFDKYSEYALYDKNSNFTYFQRYGMLNNRTYGQTDDLVFSYNGNQFKWVDDDTEQTLTYNGAFDFDDGADSNVEYTYNTNGQLTSDANSGISLIQYDMLGNPKKVTMASGDYIEYVYAPDGTKLKASHYTKWINNTYACLNTFYRGNMIYEYGVNGYPDKILFPGGYYFYESADDLMIQDYYVQDYQGNNRMVVHQYMGSDFVGQTTHYYPFGGVIGDISTNQSLQDYKYSGKEFDRTYGLDFYDFHARQYDPKVPRFTGIDQLAEDYYGISPYAYCAGDPVNCVDPDGERPKASDAALMAAYAYKDNRQAMDQYVLQLAKSGWIVSDYETSIQKDYTRFYQNGLQSTLFQRTKDGITEYAYVYAGTNSFEDAVEDVVQLAGAAPQYHTAIYNARTLSNELGNKELTFVGHSLGGGEAIASSMATGRAAITFNPATVSVLTKQFEGLNKVPNVVNYRAIGTKIGIGNIRLGGDMLNNLQEKIGLSLPGITIGIPTGIIPTHTINDFLTHKLPEL